MPQITVEPVGLLETNCYLVYVEPTGRLYIIDPGADPDVVIADANKYEYDEAVILLTHAHVDHIGAVSQIARKLNVKQIYLHNDGVALYKSPDNHLMPYVQRAENLPDVTQEISKPDFEIIETPGHTPGGVCFYFKAIPALFVGDTLFAGSIGRTDLPGGNSAQLIKSIREKLMILPDDLKVYPGHGPTSTIGREKKSNPFL
ncbi:MBL fold metallo-hydrolase [Lentisphaerota bacterium ZTH]|nr:MBL fold metallo-hydrolase [Lentisphaerota bacterium]WET06548.1 MBL fold metallo-hydrolase [Lentisphaerota bacterium ZTH]